MPVDVPVKLPPFIVKFPEIEYVSATVLVKLPAELITKFVNAFAPPRLLALKVPSNVLVPVTVRLIPPSVTDAPETTFIGPETYIVPIALPVKALPLFKVNPPTPTFVIAVALVQFAVPLMVSDKHAPGAPFIVTVFPAQITTLSDKPGIVEAAAPPQALVDHVVGLVQLPVKRE